MVEDYTVFCEKLWRSWLDDNLTAPQLAASSFTRRVFDLNSAPEPYISFGAAAKPLIVLTTNPGAPMPHQCRAAVRAGRGPLSESDKYAVAASKLGDFYEDPTRLTGQAQQRIRKVRKLCSLLGCDGVLQVEACPFHSPSLPQKRVLSQEIPKDELLGRYAECLRTFLRDRPVVCVQAASTRFSLGPTTPKESSWIKWIADIAGLDLDDAKFVALLMKNSKTTAGAWVSKVGVRKALILMMGTNNLPGDESLAYLAAELH